MSGAVRPVEPCSIGSDSVRTNRVQRDSSVLDLGRAASD